MMQPKVSMIMPVYNSEAYLGQCIESVLNQTLDDFELICINDGSTDSSAEILHKYSDIDKRIKVIDKDNSGYGASLNRGIQRAQGEYIGILESDDFAEPVMLELLYGLAEDLDLDVARANFSLFWSIPEEKDQFLELFVPQECSHVVDPSFQENQHCFYVQPAIWSALYRRTFLEQNQLTLLETPGAAYQDTSFNFKVWACASRVAFLHEPLVHYRQDNEMSSINNPGKVYAICTEYEEIERWLHDIRPDLQESLTPVVNRMKYDAYMWNCDRIGPEYQPDFVKRMSREFTNLYQQGKLDPNLFSKDLWADCRWIMRDPQNYCEYLKRKRLIQSKPSSYRRKMNTLRLVLKYKGAGAVFALVKNRLTHSNG